MKDLIFGKDETQRVVGIEPGMYNECVLFIQNEDGDIEQETVPLTHWMIYAQFLSPKMTPLKGDQPYKYLLEYDNAEKFNEILRSSRDARHDIFTMRDDKEAFMVKNGVTYYKGLKVKDVSVLSFDLEHTYGIGEQLNKDGKLLLISNTYRDSKGNITKELFSYDEYASEGEMLSAWLDFVYKMDPSILLGHNIFGHDFRILRHAAYKSGVKLRLGRDNSPLEFDHRKSMFRKDGSQSYEYFNAKAYGREIVDTFFLAIKYDVARNYENYKLKSIIKHEGLEKKDRTHYDASQIINDYKDPVKWKQIKEYAKDDADDALALYDLMIAPFFYSVNSVPRSLQHLINSASGSQINSIMVRGYLQQGHSIARSCEREDFEGAISFGIPGIHKNVLRFDVSSLYPSVMRQYKIFNKDKDPQALFLKMVNYFTEERLLNKKIGKETGDRYYKDLEQSQKIMINSMYGFLGANRVNYNYPFGASEVTRHGRRILKQSILWATGKEYTITSSEDENESA